MSRGDAGAVVLETPDALLERAEAALDGARAGEQVEVSLGSSMDTELRAYDGAIESLSSSRSDGALVRVIADGGRAGVATGSLTTPEALAELLAEARANAADAGTDPTMALAEPDGVAQPVLELYDPRIEELSIDDKRDLALGLEAAVMAGDPRMVGVEGADYGDSVVVSAIATTAGIRAAQRESGAGLSVYAMATEQGETQTGFGFAVGRAAHELSVERTAAEAVLRTVRLLGSAKPPSGRVDVVLDPWVTAQFLGVIAEMLSGEEVRKGRTPFAGRVGEAIASPLVSLADDPTDARAPGASLTDDEGLACRPVPLIEGGALTSYLHNSITGAVLGGASTGSATRSGTSLGVGPRAVALRPGATPRSELLSGVGEGVLVTEVSGLHSGVNPTSGDFSCGIEGLQIRGGEEAEPIREAIVASTLQRMLTSVVAVGDDESWFPIDASGVSLAIEGLSLAGA
ncbi:MAG: TldD/PmbA family protein [Microthrixaceae bacterium]